MPVQHSVLIVFKCGGPSRRFQPGEGPLYVIGAFFLTMKIKFSKRFVSSSSFYAVTICKGHLSECSMCSILQSCSCPGESKWQEMVERWLVKVRSGVRVQECTAHCTWHSVAPRWAHCQHSQHSTRPTPGWWHACYLFINLITCLLDSHEWCHSIFSIRLSLQMFSHFLPYLKVHFLNS